MEFETEEIELKQWKPCEKCGSTLRRIDFENYVEGKGYETTCFECTKSEAIKED
jgi:hypothetical protein